jgi:small-conductance mechanosensitive channel
VVNHTAYPVRRGELSVVLPDGDVGADVVGTVRAALATVPLVTQDPAPRVELAESADGRARFAVAYWAPDVEAAKADALAALRTRFPKAEVRGA